MDMDFALRDARARVAGKELDGSPRRQCIVQPKGIVADPMTGESDCREIMPRRRPFDPALSHRPMQPSVLQEWVGGLPFMQQTVLLTAIRGPDTEPKFGKSKPILRWYRRCILISAFEGAPILDPFAPGGGSFTGPIGKVPADGVKWQDAMAFIADDYLEARDALPHHFQMHFMHAAEIVGYKHSTPWIREWWESVYTRIVHAMHCYPESVYEMDKRLGDKIEDWQARADYSETRGVCVTCSD